MGHLKPIISPFITGYHFIHYKFNKIIYLVLFCTLVASTITRKAIIYKLKILFKLITSAPNTVSNWINKPRPHYTKKQRKTSHGNGKFSQNLCASKSIWYNERNCRSRRHGHQHTFRKHKCQTRHTTTHSPNTGLSIKSRIQISNSSKTRLNALFYPLSKKLSQ